MRPSSAPASVASPAFWRGYWITLRPYLFFVSGAGGLMGAALAPAAPGWRVAAAFAALFLSYGLGQALTDVFQTDTDALSSPYRPLVRGELARRDVLAVSLAGLALCGLVLALLSPWTLAVSALGVAGLLTYTPLKRRWWGGPAWNSWIVALLPVLGLLAAGAAPGEALAHRALLPALGSVLFSYAIFVIIGYLKDVEADRATGYATVAVRFGRRPAVVASAVALAAALACSARLLAVLPARPGAAALALWLWGAVTLALAHVRGWQVARDEDAHPAVALSVRGFVALHLGEAAAARPDLALAGVALLALFEAALALRPARGQI